MLVMGIEGICKLVFLFLLFPTVPAPEGSNMEFETDYGREGDLLQTMTQITETIRSRNTSKDTTLIVLLRVLELGYKIRQIQSVVNTNYDGQKMPKWKKMVTLNKWSDSRFSVNGAKAVSSTTLGHGQLSLLTTRDLPKGASVLSYPLKKLLTGHRSDNTMLKCLKKITYNDTAMPDMWNLIGLSLSLLKHRVNPDSKLKEYIDSLPNSYHGPMYYNLTHFELLDGTPAFDMAATYYFEFMDIYGNTWLKFFKRRECVKGLLLEQLTLDAFTWAFATALLISTKEMTKPNQYDITMIPFKHAGAETINGKLEKVLTKTDSGEDGYAFMLKQSAKAGEELFFATETDEPIDHMQSFVLYGIPNLPYYPIRFKASKTKDERTFNLPDPKLREGQRYLADEEFFALVDISNNERTKEVDELAVTIVWNYLLIHVESHLKIHESKLKTEVEGKDNNAKITELIRKQLIMEKKLLIKIRAHLKVITENKWTKFIQ